MREIKFRGQMESGEIVYGFLSVLQNAMQGIGRGVYISNAFGAPFAFKVKPESVGQCTGFNDNNGKEIYEGMDVIGKWGNSDKSYKFKIGFKNGAFVMINEFSLYFNLSRAFDPDFVNDGFTLEIVENE